MTKTSRKAHPATGPRTSTLDRITRMRFAATSTTVSPRC